MLRNRFGTTSMLASGLYKYFTRIRIDYEADAKVVIGGVEDFHHHVLNLNFWSGCFGLSGYKFSINPFSIRFFTFLLKAPVLLSNPNFSSISEVEHCPSSNIQKNVFSVSLRLISIAWPPAWPQLRPLVCPLVFNSR